MGSYKRILKLQCFYSLKILTFPFYLKSLVAFLFLSFSLSIFPIFSLFFYAPTL
jgi:hypothetical protein